jgi:L-fuculose-phosphate aldolase
MSKEHLTKQLQSFALSLFRKDFLGIYHGSLSAKTEKNRFLINTKEAVFDALENKDLIELYFKQDYRWNQASIDAAIHHSIYSNISEAKFISFTIPPYTTAYALNHNIILPQDYFASKLFGTIEIIDPKNFDNWYERAPSEILNYFKEEKNNIIVIRGYGVYAYNRDLHEMIKLLATLEKTSQLLLLKDRA